MKVLLKEIKESGINLRIIIEKPVIAYEKFQIAFFALPQGYSLMPFDYLVRETG
jgi:hypothetical protein